MDPGKALSYLLNTQNQRVCALGLMQMFICPDPGDCDITENDPYGRMFAAAFATIQTGDDAFVNSLTPALREHVRQGYRTLMSIIRGLSPLN